MTQDRFLPQTYHRYKYPHRVAQAQIYHRKLCLAMNMLLIFKAGLYWMLSTAFSCSLKKIMEVLGSENHYDGVHIITEEVLTAPRDWVCSWKKCVFSNTCIFLFLMHLFPFQFTNTHTPEKFIYSHWLISVFSSEGSWQVPFQ